MSSVLSAYSQVPVRQKFFLVVGTPASGQSVSLNAGAKLEALVTTTAFTAATTASLPVAGQLWRSLGKVVTVYDATTNLATQKFAAVQLVSGAAGEGVGPGSLIRYIRVWGANASDTVCVVRTG